MRSRPFFVVGHRSVTCGQAAQVLDGERCSTGGKRVRPDQEITEGLKLGVIAVVSAVLTATLIIGAGQALLPKAGVAQAEAARHPALTQAALR